MRARTAITVLAFLPVALATVTADADGVREVSASTRAVIPLQTKLRYTTMVLLPDDEEILDVVCGDKDFWVISATQNIAHIKPAKEGAATNVNEDPYPSWSARSASSVKRAQTPLERPLRSIFMAEARPGSSPRI